MGYDHNYVTRGPRGASALRPVARVYEPTSGRILSVRSNQPGVQFYTGNYLDGSVGRGGGSSQRREGITIESTPGSASRRRDFRMQPTKRIFRASRCGLGNDTRM